MTRKELLKEKAFPTVLLLLAAILYLTGCKDSAAQGPQKTRSQLVYEQRQEAVNELTYHRDEASGLCFAVATSTTTHAYTVSSVTYAPCTSAVEAIIEKAKQKAEKQ